MFDSFHPIDTKFGVRMHLLTLFQMRSSVENFMATLIIVFYLFLTLLLWITLILTYVMKLWMLYRMICHTSDLHKAVNRYVNFCIRAFFYWRTGASHGGTAYECLECSKVALAYVRMIFGCGLTTQTQAQNKNIPLSPGCNWLGLHIFIGGSDISSQVVYVHTIFLR